MYWFYSKRSNGGKINLEENVRLQKFIASSGVASRRKAEELILQGKIKVNEKIITGFNLLNRIWRQSAKNRR